LAAYPNSATYRYQAMRSARTLIAPPTWNYHGHGLRGTGSRLPRTKNRDISKQVASHFDYRGAVRPLK